MPKKILKKELIKKEDGRYLYLYSWAGDEAEKDAEKEETPKAGKTNENC
ncbi:MAG: hypothetical protein GX890_06575 [Firmicutes bacterium]|jgi:predicted transcriptional regulator|nr:hypothetical protein [Bacillota bacterium]HPU02096.1 hypothetical protein [Bacillota bacterium]